MTEWIKRSDRECPLDGTPFLCYDPKQIDNFPEAIIYVVKWVKESLYSKVGFIETGGECYFMWEPTHWMPLPKEPSND